jgi:hypothetical protein
MRGASDIRLLTSPQAHLDKWVLERTCPVIRLIGQ